MTVSTVECFQAMIQNKNEESSVAIAHALALKNEDSAEFLDGLLSFILVTAESQARSAKALDMYIDCHATDDNELCVGKLIDFLYRNDGGITVPIVNWMSQGEDLDKFLDNLGDTFSSVKVKGLKPETALKKITALKAFTELEDSDDFNASLNGIMKFKSTSAANQVNLVKAAAISCISDPAEIEEGEFTNDSLSEVKAMEDIADDFGELARKNVNGVTLLLDEGETVYGGFIDIINGDNYQGFIKSLDETEKKVALTVEGGKPSNGKVAKKTFTSMTSSTHSIMMKTSVDDLSSKSKMELPEKLDGESQDDWLNRLTPVQEKSWLWKHGLTKEEKIEKFNGKFNTAYSQYAKTVRQERLDKYGITSVPTKKAPIKSVEKKLANFKLEDMKPEDVIEDVIDDIHGASNSGLRIFLTESGHIAYPIKLSNTFVHFSEVINKLKESYGIDSNTIKYYYSPTFPTIKEKKLFFEKEKECVIAVTDIVFEDVSAFVADKDFDQQFKQMSQVDKSTFCLKLKAAMQFRWYTRCNEDFYTIINYNGSLRLIGDSQNTSGVNLRKDITKSNSKLKDCCLIMNSPANAVDIDKVLNVSKEGLVEHVKKEIQTTSDKMVNDHLTHVLKRIECEKEIIYHWSL